MQAEPNSTTTTAATAPTQETAQEDTGSQADSYLLTKHQVEYIYNRLRMMLRVAGVRELPNRLATKSLIQIADIRDCSDESLELLAKTYLQFLKDYTDQVMGEATEELS